MLMKTKVDPSILKINIRIRRAILGLSQAELGDLIEVSTQTINTWENNPPTSFQNKNLENLATVLKCSASWLLNFKIDSDEDENKAKEEVEKKGFFDFKSPERKAFDKNRQKFHTLLDNIFDQGSTPQRREIMGALIDLDGELGDKNK